MPYCPTCGEEVLYNAEICPHCGVRRIAEKKVETDSCGCLAIGGVIMIFFGLVFIGVAITDPMASVKMGSKDWLIFGKVSATYFIPGLVLSIIGILFIARSWGKI
jgi:hypothetical protein